MAFEELPCAAFGLIKLCADAPELGLGELLPECGTAHAERHSVVAASRASSVSFSQPSKAGSHQIPFSMSRPAPRPSGVSWQHGS